MIFNELHKGIDSLYISFIGILNGRTRRTLERVKFLAQSEDAKERVGAVIKINDHCFEVSDRGRGNYKYVLIDGHYQILISDSRRKNLPTIYVQISSELLNVAGVDCALNELRSIVKQLLKKTPSEAVSRADIFVDFTTDVDFGEFESSEWVTRAISTNKRCTGTKCVGWEIGIGGNIYCRPYNKTSETSKTGKAYFKEIWTRAGWIEGQPVWRVEFQLRKEPLKQLSIHSVADLVSSLNDVWRYCTYKWLRLAVDDGTKNRSRWETHPLWSAIQQVKFGDGIYLGITRDASSYRSRVPSDKTLFQSGFGYITSYAAATGHDDITWETLLGYIEDIQKFYESSPSILGFDSFSDFARTKIKLKKRKFNKG